MFLNSVAFIQSVYVGSLEPVARYEETKKTSFFAEGENDFRFYQQPEDRQRGRLVENFGSSNLSIAVALGECRNV